jgi:hypothetical protein
VDVAARAESALQRRRRAVSAPRADWPNTLRGEAAEINLRWEHDLKPHGFGISARVLDFPEGMPGDIGLFLLWGLMARR